MSPDDFNRPAMLRGVYLTRMALMVGLKRRWFGLEPDFILRKRILKKIKL